MEWVYLKCQTISCPDHVYKVFGLVVFFLIKTKKLKQKWRKTTFFTPHKVQEAMFRQYGYSKA